MLWWSVNSFRDQSQLHSVLFAGAFIGGLNVARFGNLAHHIFIIFNSP